MNDTTSGSQSVYIYSGEITSSGIRNHYRALIITKKGTNTISRGQGRLVYDSDGFSEKTQGQGRQVIIDMYDSSSDGWDHDGALRIYVNGADLTARLSSGSFGSYSFYVDTGDVVNIYWTGDIGDYHNENAFVVYYADNPPVPIFNKTAWSGTNALLYRVEGSLSNADLNQVLDYFSVSSLRPSITLSVQGMKAPSSEGLLPEISSSRY
jgi:hypothetical protein